MTAVPPGAGLGLRRHFLPELLVTGEGLPDFLELAPENWLGMGGRYARQLAAVAERFPLRCHGLSLSVGGTRPLDTDFLTALRGFLDRYDIADYSEHLSYSTDTGHLYDLLPMPFTEAAVHHVAARVREVQERLGRRIALENVSYYAAPATDLSEAEFLCAVLAEADCDLLLDVNNVYVNSVNHGYDAEAFMAALPASRLRYVHVAGHYEEAPDLLVDTHGADVAGPVWDLLASVYRRFGPLTTVLERDFNLPPLPQLLAELAQVRQHQQAATHAEAVDDVS